MGTSVNWPWGRAMGSSRKTLNPNWSCLLILFVTFLALMGRTKRKPKFQGEFWRIRDILNWHGGLLYYLILGRIAWPNVAIPNNKRVGRVVLVCLYKIPPWQIVKQGPRCRSGLRGCAQSAALPQFEHCSQGIYHNYTKEKILIRYTRSSTIVYTVQTWLSILMHKSLDSFVIILKWSNVTVVRQFSVL